MWKSQGTWKKETEGLTSRVQELEADAEKHDAAITERDEKITKLEADAAAAQPSTEQVNKERDAALKERDEAKAEATPEKIEAKALTMLQSAEAPAAVQKVIAARVTEELAKAGHPGVVADAEQQPGGTGKTITKAEFDAMSHPDRNAFFRNGGKLKD